MSSCQSYDSPCDVPYNYDVGDLVRIRAAYTNPVDDAPIDPTTVVLDVTSPSGIVTQPQIFNDEVGSYYAFVEALEAELWHYAWRSTGVGQAVEQGVFRVRPVGAPTCPSAEEQAESDLRDRLQSPRRVRGDQGEVESRSADEEMKADKYLQKRQWNRHALLQDSVIQNTRYKNCP